MTDAFSRLTSEDVDVGRFYNNVTGHHGVNATFEQMIAAVFDAKGLRKEISDFINRCPFFQKASDKPHILNGGKFTLSSYESKVIIAIDEF